MLNGNYAKTDEKPDDFIYVAINMHWEMHGFELPQLPEGYSWHIFSNTGMESPHDICEPGKEVKLHNQNEVLVGDRSIIILVGKKEGNC